MRGTHIVHSKGRTLVENDVSADTRDSHYSQSVRFLAGVWTPPSAFRKVSLAGRSRRMWSNDSNESPVWKCASPVRGIMRDDQPAASCTCTRDGDARACAYEKDSPFAAHKRTLELSGTVLTRVVCYDPAIFNASNVMCCCVRFTGLSRTTRQRLANVPLMPRTVPNDTSGKRIRSRTRLPMARCDADNPPTIHRPPTTRRRLGRTDTVEDRDLRFRASDTRRARSSAPSPTNHIAPLRKYASSPIS